MVLLNDDGGRQYKFPDCAKRPYAERRGEPFPCSKDASDLSGSIVHCILMVEIIHTKYIHLNQDV